MFLINEDLSIYVTRGDVVFFTVSAEENGVNYVFKSGDVVRVKVFEKKSCEKVVLQKDFPVTAETEHVDIILTGQDTKIGNVISKPVDYWYEVELNPFTNPQTIIGYDDDGAKIFKLFPEGRDLVDEPEEEIPSVDASLDPLSTRPVQNQAIARAIMGLDEKMANINENIKETVSDVLSTESINADLEYDAENEALTLKLSNVGGA
ncbi:MAG: hypothetical protein E7288_10505 [Lachnospiraceae bacterium]|nr:hypothetical protein [Lachnospiraceae bacterium]